MDIKKLTDLGLIGTLLTLGYKLGNIDKDGPKRVSFEILGEEQEIQERIKEYYNDDIRVNPRDFADNLKRVKAIIYGLI